MPDIWYPKADNTVQNFTKAYERPVLTTSKILALHTTETPDWPGYGGGAEAPNLTYHPAKRASRGHFPMNRAARALKDPDGTPVKENWVCTQIEIVATCDERKRGQPGWLFIEDLTSAQLDDIADILAFVNRNLGVPISSTVTWKPYASGTSAGSYGVTNGVRLSSNGFAAYTGVLGHQHVSGNDHGDPGKPKIAEILARAKSKVAPAPKPPAAPAKPPAAKPPTPPVRPKVSLRALLASIQTDKSKPTGYASNKANTLLVERALVAEGLLAGNLADGSAGTSTFGQGSAYQRWQRSLGLTGSAADGIPGMNSLTALGKKRGFDVI